MITTHLGNYHTVTTDALYQWDKGQKLQIQGLTYNPIVHFASKAVTKAYVISPESYENDIAIIEIPDTLLEEPYDINAYVVDNDKTTHVITIPVIARPEPDSV